jgi:neutral ceramidase
MASLQAGASRGLITPPVGVDLAGYGYRPGPSIDVHDDLSCTALILDDGRTRLALIALDLLETDFEVDALLRRAVAEAAGLPPNHILINCSHTHAGPPVARVEGLGRQNADYIDLLRARVAETAAAAVSDLTPAAVRCGEAPVRVGINRRETTADGTVKIGRNPEGIADTHVRVVEIGRREKPRLLLFHHACHGTTMGGENRRITSEWMGAAAARLAAESAGTVIPMFLQGCCGQMNPDAEPSFNEIDRLGGTMAAAVKRALDSAEDVSAEPLAVRMEQIELPFQPPLSPEDARAELRRAEAERDRVGKEGAHEYVVRAHGALVRHAARMLERAEHPPAHEALKFAVQVLRLGDLAFVGLSGEVFFEFAQAIESRSPFPHTLVLGYANGCTCYIPTAQAFAEGGYEAVNSFRWYGLPPLAPQAGEVMAEEAVRILNDTWKGSADR